MRSGPLVALLLRLALAGTAGAQTASPRVESVQVELWPEYDRAEVLVMYRFRLAPDASLSEPVPLPVPASTGEPHAVAWRDADGSLFVAGFTRSVEDERAVIRVQMGSRDGQLEFYDELTFEDGRRAYTFEWPGGISVGALSFRVQEPRGARDVVIDPEPERRFQGGDGLTYAVVPVGPIDASATPEVAIRYEKDSDALTAPSSVAPTTSTAAPTSPGGVPRWSLALAGASIAAVAAWLAVRSRRAAPGGRPAGSGEGLGVFCHNCGTRSQPSHAFCMECGTKLVKPGRG